MLAYQEHPCQKVTLPPRLPQAGTDRGFLPRSYHNIVVLPAGRLVSGYNFLPPTGAVSKAILPQSSQGFHKDHKVVNRYNTDLCAFTETCDSVC